MPTRLDRAYQAQARRVRDQAEAFARARFTAGEFRDADMAVFLRTVVPVIVAAQRTISALTAAWLGRRLTEALGRTVSLPALSDLDLRGVPASEVYGRPFKTVWWNLSQGKTLDEAVAAGVKRTEDIVRADMQLAKTHTAREVLERQPEVTRYRRTLTGDVNCALCFVASTQTYSTKDLLPIHPGCDCGVDPVVGVFDEDETLRQTHEAVEERFGFSDAGARRIDYSKLLVVREHGELGPVLTVKGHHFTGPDAQRLAPGVRDALATL